MAGVKLYELKKGAKIYEQLMSNVGKVFFESDVENDPIIFDHVDGMYSYCYLESNPKMVVHLSASTPLEAYKDGYKIADHTAKDHEEVKDAGNIGA
jgi:hypothetical protein